MCTSRPGPRAAVQAWGYDSRDRKQYRYHGRAIERGQLRKYYRVRALAHELPEIRRAVDRDFRSDGMSQRRVAAAVVRLISQGFFRVGSERYTQENRTFGITTLRTRHLHIHGDALEFTYTGKSSKEQRQVVVDPHLVEFMAELRRAPGRRLFRYRGEDGKWHDLTARDVNGYLHDRLGVRYSAKDFRTWGGTLRAATVLAELGPAESERAAKKNVVTAVRLVAAELGNTPAICRASYVHPIVIARYLDAGETIQPTARQARAHERHTHAPEEAALIEFLDRHFPERRKRTPKPRSQRKERREE